MGISIPKMAMVPVFD